jgi:peptide/nickel transport system ATP-binding protein
VDGVSLEVRAGETLGLVGESGCGKSTLGRGVLGLLPDSAATAGEVSYRGRDILQIGPKEMRQLRGPELGLIFQEPMTRLNPLISIEDHFIEALRAHEPDLEEEQMRRRSLEALGGMGIPPTRFKQYPHEFSGGMRQRIMIALALVLRPKVLVADEPTTALDVIVEAQILGILADLRRNFDTALLLITHNLGIVAEACDRVAVMYAGRIAEVGEARRVFTEPAHPYTRELLRSTISLRTTGLHYIPGAPPNLIEPPSGCRFHPRCPNAMQVCPAKDPVEVEIGGEGASQRVACWLHGPESEIPEGGRAPLEREEIGIAEEA